MNIVKKLLALFACAAIVSCGGGGSDAGAPPFGGGGSPTTEAARLSLVLSSYSVSNGGEGTVEATATVTDAKGQTLEGVEVRFEVDADASFTQEQSATDARGEVKALVSIGGNRANRTVTVKAKAGKLTAERSFAVTGSRLTGTPLPAIVQPGSTGNRVEFRLVDVNGLAMAGFDITVTAPGVAEARGKTGMNGEYDFVYTAPSTTGNLDISASAAGTQYSVQVLVQSASVEVPVVTLPIRAATVDATPNVVAVNQGGSRSNRSEIRALFLSDNNAPIPNVRVRFKLADSNSIPGSFSAGDNIVYTDAGGVASTAYFPGDRASPTNGVTVRACYNESDFGADECPKWTDVKLTVTNEPIGITIGTDEVIQEGEGGLTYIKQYVVLAVNSSGQAMPNVEITPSIDLLRYRKGWYEWNGDVWMKRFPTQGDPDGWGRDAAICENEDRNRNGVLEGSGPSGEDLDSDGQLEPRRSDVSIRMVGSTRTDASGRAILQIEYPQNVASWVDFQILVAGAVAGSEGRATFTGNLPVSADDASDEKVSPAFAVSPYGVMPSCFDPN